MTTSIVWPASLPCFQFSPYNVAPRPASLEMTLGMVTRRARIYSENNELFSVELVLSSAQEQTFRTFFKTTTSMGTQSFLVSLLMEGTYEEREATFYGAPPTFSPVAQGYVRSSFLLLAKRTPYTITYELIASQEVNINALDFSSTGSLGGTIVPMSALATDRIEITKPSIASDPALTWDAWSNFNNDGANGGLSWLNNFKVSDQDDAQILFVSITPQANVAAALAALQAQTPILLTGSTEYQFWSSDPITSDNRRGLSLRVKTYRPVIS